MKYSALCAALLGVFVFFTVGNLNAQIGFDPTANYTVGDQPDTSTLGDFNGDGNLDIAVTSDNPDKVQILFNQGNGTFGVPNDILLAGGSSPQSVVAGDLDGNGSVDLAVSLKGTSSVQVLFNNGSGVFSLGSSFAVGSEPRHMAIGDLDGVNNPDIVTSNRDSNNISVLLNTGAGSFGAASTHSTGVEPRSVTLGDFDGNLSLDIAVSAHDDREINLFINQGNGTFAAGADLSLGAQLRPDGIVAHDLDCNGSIDLAASASGGGLNVASVFLNNGSGSFTGPTNFNVGALDPSDIVSADFDLDGDPDLATVNTDSNNVSTLPGNGTGGFGAASQFTVGTLPGHLIAGDLDGNGSKDVVTTNEATDNVSVLINQDSGWIDLGFGLAGTGGVPVLAGTGAIEEGETLTLSLTGALENASAFFVVGISRIDLPFKGGTFVPAPTIAVLLTTSAAGSLTLSGPTPGGIPKGLSLYFQVWIEDPGAVAGYAASNALEGLTQ